jgi:catechol 2,3-dioxygenase-like lactoylglutathione lyase family enzyme
MGLGTLNHITITVSELARSAPFYDGVLTFMGYRRDETCPQWISWVKPGYGAVVISPADPASPNQAHDRYSPGLHHFAFDADSRAEVDGLHAVLIDIGARVLDPPAEYHYCPGYYAVFFADPDGIKLELCHTPGNYGSAAD